MTTLAAGNDPVFHSTAPKLHLPWQQGLERVRGSNHGEHGVRVPE